MFIPIIVLVLLFVIPDVILPLLLLYAAIIFWPITLIVIALGVIVAIISAITGS